MAEGFAVFKVSLNHGNNTGKMGLCASSEAVKESVGEDLVPASPNSPVDSPVLPTESKTDAPRDISGELKAGSLEVKKNTV